MVFRVKSHVYAFEGQDCQYKQMFGSELRGVVSVVVMWDLNWSCLVLSPRRCCSAHKPLQGTKWFIIQ